jgi:uncharacterized protein (DUF58 family)
VSIPATSREVALSRRGWSLIGAAVGLVVGSYLLGALEMLVLACSALLLLGASLAYVALSRQPVVVVRREVRTPRLHVGGEGRIEIVVESHDPSPTPLLWVTDSFDAGRRAARFLVPPLGPGEVARAAYRIPSRRRGRYQVGPLWVGFNDPFGLARRMWLAAPDTEVAVRPRTLPILAPLTRHAPRGVQGDITGSRVTASVLGDELLGLRDYEVGDDLRRVHWPSTARRDELTVRQDDARWRARAAVVLDQRAEAHDEHSFEVALEATASVVARLARLRRSVEVLTSSATKLGVAGDPRHDVIDRLVTLGPEREDRLGPVLQAVRAHRQVDLVVAVLGDVDDTVRAALDGLVGISVIVVLTRPASVPGSATRTVVDASDTPFAEAWDRVHARHPRDQWTPAPAP